jgi:hypothetical protein
VVEERVLELETLVPDLSLIDDCPISVPELPDIRPRPLSNSSPPY